MHDPASSPSSHRFQPSSRSFYGIPAGTAAIDMNSAPTMKYLATNDANLQRPYSPLHDQTFGITTIGCDDLPAQATFQYASSSMQHGAAPVQDGDLGQFRLSAEGYSFFEHLHDNSRMTVPRQNIGTVWARVGCLALLRTRSLSYDFNADLYCALSFGKILLIPRDYFFRWRADNLSFFQALRFRNGLLGLLQWKSPIAGAQRRRIRVRQIPQEPPDNLAIVLPDHNCLPQPAEIGGIVLKECQLFDCGDSGRALILLSEPCTYRTCGHLR